MAPLRNFSKFSYPTANETDNPTEPQTENLPPTKSYILKILFLSRPNSTALLILEVTPMKCFEISSIDLLTRNSLIFLALVNVSCVVNVLETIINTVVSGSTNFRTSFR